MKLSKTITVVATVFLACGVSLGQTHAPWPTDWNDWSDPALWATVGDPGNAGELSGAGAGGLGSDRICGAVNYEYRIGKYEVTAGQYTAFLNAVAKTDAHGLYNAFMWAGHDGRGCKINRLGSEGSYTYEVAADWANRPVNYVTWGDAARFCNWLTNGQPTGYQDLSTTEDGSYYLNGETSDAALNAVTRKEGGRYFIPTEDEWYKAAYYNPATESYYDYPTGSNSVPSNDLIDPDPGNNANYYQGDYTINSLYWRTEAGEFEHSASPYGTFDQGGNVWEWNEQVINTAYRGIRGSAFGYPNHLELSAAARDIYGSPGDGAPGDDNLGFRVVEVPEPATLSLLALGGLVVIRRRKGAER